MAEDEREREWTGRLWTAAETIDGRRIIPGALMAGEPAEELPEPIPLRDYPGEHSGERVGTVTAIAELYGVGIAIGRTTLPPGRYPVAISLGGADFEVSPRGEELLQVVTEARLVAVTLARSPAWPDTEITVHGDTDDEAAFLAEVTRPVEPGNLTG